MTAKTDLIRAVPLFAHCSKNELDDVASIADELDLPEGKVLTEEGDRGREFFVLVEGSVEVTRGGKQVNTLGAGDFLGEMALVSDHPRVATITTTSPVRALVITDRHFRALLERSPELQRKVFRAMADRLAQLLD